MNEYDEGAALDSESSLMASLFVVISFRFLCVVYPLYVSSVVSLVK